MKHWQLKYPHCNFELVGVLIPDDGHGKYIFFAEGEAILQVTRQFSKDYNTSLMHSYNDLANLCKRYNHDLEDVLGEADRFHRYQLLSRKLSAGANYADVCEEFGFAFPRE